jgi:tetratricopeptide (TPR) repeat protein
MNQSEAAIEAFRDALRVAPSLALSPGDRRAFARSLARTGAHEEALTHYRALLPQLDWLAPNEQYAARLEAACTAIAWARETKSADDRMRRLELATASLGTDSGRAPFEALLVASLALGRAGRAEQAQAALANAALAAPSNPALAESAAWNEADRLALAALRAEVLTPQEAPAAWDRVLAVDSSGPEADHARARRAELAAPKRAAGPRSGPRRPR